MTGDFGHYTILSEIGRGGMGIVYQAVDMRTDQMVAIKQLIFNNVDPAKEKEFRDRFKREAATAQRLNHPNIVTVYDVSTTGENYFYVMEFLSGHSLRTELEVRGGKLTTREFWPILSQVAEGLSHAHSMNVVHRDVKPDNIFLLDDGRVKITDFGIARAADFEQTHLTKTGVMMGTLAYVSPEQLQDAKNVDHRADIFSLGVVCYESLSGQVPFTGDGIAQTIVKIVSQEEKPLHILMPFINVETSTTITKALRKRARERYRSVREFTKDFEASIEKESQTAEVESPSTPSISLSHVVTEAGGQQEREDVKELRAKMRRATVQSTTDVSLSDQIVLGDLHTYKTPNPALSQPQVPKPVQPGGARPPVRPESAEYQAIRPLQIIDCYGKNKTKLVEPAVLSYRSGRLVVADTATRQVHMFGLDGRWMGDLTCRAESQETKTRGGSLTKPSGIAIDPKGRIYICDSSDPYVRIFDSRGLFMKELCNIQGKDGGIQGIALDSTGLLYLSDVANAGIQVFQSDLGLWMRTIKSPGQLATPLQLPAGLAVDRLNQIYCADYGSSYVSVFSKTGAFIRSFGGKGTANGLFNVPRAVAVDGNDKIYVLDSLNHRVQVFGPTGDWFYTFGGRGTDPGKFIGPSDLSIDLENESLYIADKGNQRIQVFALCQK